MTSKVEDSTHSSFLWTVENSLGLEKGAILRSILFKLLCASFNFFGSIDILFFFAILVLLDANCK